MKSIVLVLSTIVLIAALTACASAPTVTPLPAPTQVPASPTNPPAIPTTAPTATKIPPTATTAPTQAPTAAPATATTVPPTATTVPPTATRVPPTPTTAPTNTVVPSTPVPAGLYISTLRMQPDRPAFNQDVTFAASFINVGTTELNIKWAVYIFKADQPNITNNETTAQTTTFPPGSKDTASPGAFRYGPTGRTCEYFFARVGYFTSENKIVWTTTTDSKVYEKGFEVCDVSVIPTSVPVTQISPTTVPPTPKPGLFVTDLRIQPAAQRGVDLTFIPTFSNNSGSPLTFTWRVFIYKADNLATSYSETTWTTTNFTTTPGEVQSLGKWILPLGGPCENYFARVGWQDANNQTQFFMRPDGTVFSKSFTVCPP